MRIRTFVMVTSTATALAVAPPAQSAAIVQGDWGEGDARASCTSGVNTRQCTYEVVNTVCYEVTASTGTGIWVTIPCAASFTGTVTVQPRLNASGHVVGCTSVVGTEKLARVQYDSNVSNQFDRLPPDQIPVNLITVSSTSSSQTNAVVTFSGRTTASGYVWTATGTLTATCAPSATSTSRTTAGKVTVTGESVQS